MASLGLGWMAEPALAALIEPTFDFLPARLAVTTTHSIAVALAFLIITALQLVFGELTPKWIALERSESTAMWLVQPLEIFMQVFSPFIRLVHVTAQTVIKMVGLHGADRRAMVHSEEELKMLVTASQEAGVLEEQEEQMLHRVFGFADLTAGQVMIPRTELVAVAAEMALGELVASIGAGRHTRLPVYRDDLDNVVGMLHLTDLLRALAGGDGGVNAGALAREVLTVPETLGADDLLTEMRQRRAREALVIDEYGGTAGLVTFESLMERIVGEIPASPGAGAGRRTARRVGRHRRPALVTDVNGSSHSTSTRRPTPRSADTLGRLGRRARVGDAIDVDGRKMRVEAVDGMRWRRCGCQPRSNPAQRE
jgi:CBS domain containing-hemolysin-like protein